MPVQYLLDTNILVHAIRIDDVWSRIQAHFQLLAVDPTPMISVVTAGELRSLAYQRGWGTAKLNQMEFMLGYYNLVNIDDAIIETYAIIDSQLQLRGHTLGKNDLWIAASAKVTGATLITTDKDFDCIHPEFLTRVWIDPDIKAA